MNKNYLLNSYAIADIILQDMNISDRIQVMLYKCYCASFARYKVVENYNSSAQATSLKTAAISCMYKLLSWVGRNGGRIAKHFNKCG